MALRDTFQPGGTLSGWGNIRRGESNQEKSKDWADPAHLFHDERPTQEQLDEEAKKKADEDAIRKQADLLNTTGVSELGAAQTAWDKQITAGERDASGRYKGLEPGEYAGLDRTARRERALAADFAGRMGVSGGSLEYSLGTDIEENYRIAEANALKDAKAQIFKEGEVHYQNAVTALGMSNTTLTNLYKIHAQEAADAQSAKQDLLATVATLVATYYGGAAGGAVAKTVFDKKKVARDGSSYDLQGTEYPIT